MLITEVALKLNPCIELKIVYRTEIIFFQK